MKLKNYYLLGVGMMIVSCSNNSDFFPSFNDDISWELSLNEIISDNKDIFADRDIEITEVKLMKDMRIDSTLFFDSKYGYFPVFSKKDSLFEIIQYDEIDRNEKEYSFNKKVVNDKISKLLEKSEDYDIIQLTWRFGSDKFQSLSLFNKKTGELEYDNMLFNMTTISKYNGISFAMILRGAEDPKHDFSGGDVVNHRIGLDVVASARIDWVVKGHWNTETHLVSEDQNHKYFVTYYTYCVDSTRIWATCNAESGYETFAQYSNKTSPYQPRYAFLYAIWAGPQGEFISSNFNLNTTNTDNFNARFELGSGLFKDVQHSPYQAPVYFSINK